MNPRRRFLPPQIKVEIKTAAEEDGGEDRGESSVKINKECSEVGGEAFPPERSIGLRECFIARPDLRSFLGVLFRFSLTNNCKYLEIICIEYMRVHITYM